MLHHPESLAEPVSSPTAYPMSCIPETPPAEVERFEWNASDGAPLVAHWWGPERPWAVLLMLHGIGMHGSPYASIAGGLTSSGVALCVPDVRGHGESGTPGRLPTLRQLTSDLDEVAARIRQRCSSPVFLGGESMGGLFISQYARQRQTDYAGLILVVPAFQVHESRLRTAPDVATLLSQGRVLIDTPENLRASSRDEGFVLAKRSDPTVVHAVSLRFLAQIGLWGASWFWHAAHFHMPTLMNLAERDEAICNLAAQRVYEDLPSVDKSLVIWPQALHTLCWDPVTPDLIARTVQWMRARV